MSRRVSLPGADELFRNTATLSAVPSQRESAEEITEAPDRWLAPGGAQRGRSGSEP